MVSVWAADITPLLIEETYQAYYMLKSSTDFFLKKEI